LAIRRDYRLRRIFHDPAGDFTENRILVGLSLILHNHAR